MNAFTTKEYTAFYIRLLAEDLPLGLDVLGAIMTDPALRADDIDAERQVILDEILMHADEPADFAAEQCTAAMFPDHPLGPRGARRPRPASRPSTQAGDPRASSTRHYRAGNLVVAAAGDVDHDRLAAEVERRFAGRSGGAVAAAARRPTPRRRPCVVHRAPDRAGAPGRGHALPRAGIRPSAGPWPCSTTSWAGGSPAGCSRRSANGGAWPTRSGPSAPTTTRSGALTVNVGTAPEHAREVLDLVHGELDRMGDEGITDRELAVAKGHLRAETLLSLEDSGARMSRIGSSLLLHGHVLEVDDILAKVDGRHRRGRGRRGRARWPAQTRTLSVVGPVRPGGDVTSGQRCTRASVGFDRAAGGRARRRWPDGPRGVPGGGRGPRPRAGGGRRPRAWPASTCARSPAPTAPASRSRATSTPWRAPGPRWPSTSPWPTPPLENMRWCAAHGVHAVVGTTGHRRRRCSTSCEASFEASSANCVLAANFAIGAVLMMRFAELAAPFMDGVEIIELHHDGKLDAPSGTALHTAERCSNRPGAPAAADPWPADRTASDRGGRGPRRRGARRGPGPLGAAPGSGGPPGGHLRCRSGQSLDHPPRRLRPHLVHARGDPGREGGGGAGPGSPSASTPCSASDVTPTWAPLPGRGR